MCDDCARWNVEDSEDESSSGSSDEDENDQDSHAFKINKDWMKMDADLDDVLDSSVYEPLYFGVPVTLVQSVVLT